MRLLALLLLTASTASAQTVADIAARGACSTSGVEAISQQLAEAQMCLRPGGFVRFAPHPGITLSSSRVHPYLQASARDALHRAAARRPITINSAFRTVADQYVLYHSGGCGLAARPGSSNHQSGRAVDVASYSTVRSSLEAESCAWLGSRDPVHFDCPGTDRRSDSVLAFQRLWNANNPGDRISEDGLYGPQTESRLARAPAGGFATSGCGCEPGCDGNAIVAADCTRTACAGVCMDDGTPRCIDAGCADDGVRCENGSTVLVCSGGEATRTSCNAGETCSEGACRPVVDEPCAGIEGTLCLDAMTLGLCAGGLERSMGCPAGCVGMPGAAACVPTPDASLPDAGIEPDAGDAPDADPVSNPSRTAIGSCSAHSSQSHGGLWLIALIFLKRRHQY